MDEPSYDVIANPISSFTTFGEAAPSQQVVARENLTPPVDFISPLVRQMEMLSNTLAGIFAENKRKESQQALVMGGTEVEASLPEILKARKENALDVATLVDKGILTNNENPWFAVGARRALAKLNVEAVSDMIDRDLDNDFLQGGDLMDNDEPTTAIANYMGNKMNPLNIAESVQKDYYYASAFEEGFSKIRRRATKRLIELRTTKEYEDQVNALRADLGFALRNGSERPDINPNAMGLDGEPITALDPEAAAVSVLGDYNYRAAFGNSKTLEIGGLHLLDLAKDGDQLALQVLTQTKLPNGKTLLESSDAVKVQYDLAEDQIAGAISRANNELIKARNIATVEDAKTRIAVEMGSVGLNINAITPDFIANRVEGVEIDPRDGSLLIPQEGGDPKKIPFDEMKDRARVNRHQTRQRAASQATDDPFKASFAAAQSSFNQDKYVDPNIRILLADGMDLIEGGRNTTEEDIPKIQAALAYYRMFKNSEDKSLMGAFLPKEGEQEMYYLLDILERGDQGQFGDLGIGSGDIERAMATLSRVGGIELTASDIEFTGQDGIREELESSIRKAGFDPVLSQRLIKLAEIRYKIMGTGGENAASFASQLINTFTVTRKHFSYMTTSGLSISEDEGEALFTNLIEAMQDSKGERLLKITEGPVASLVHELALQQSDGEPGSNEYKEVLSQIKFVNSGEADGTFRIVYNNTSTFDRLTEADFRRQHFVTLAALRSRKTNPVVNGEFETPLLLKEPGQLGNVDFLNPNGTRNPSIKMKGNRE